MALCWVVAAPAVGTPNGTQRGRGGIWIERANQLVKITPRQFQKAFGVTWSRRQTLGPELTPRTLPGYSDGPGSFDPTTGEPSSYVAPQYVPTAAERRAIQGHTAPLYVGKINDRVGHGLLAREVIRKGNVIGEYTGVVRREDRERDKLNAYTFVYDPWGVFRMHVDAKDEGNYLRFANHSDANANAASKLVYDQKNSRWHVLLVATQDIHPRQQVLFSYGNQYDWSRFGLTPSDLAP